MTLLVVGNGHGATIAHGTQAGAVDTLADQVTHHRLGTLLRKLLVVFVGTFVVGMALDLEVSFGEFFHEAGHVVQRTVAALEELGGVQLELDALLEFVEVFPLVERATHGVNRHTLQLSASIITGTRTPAARNLVTIRL